MNVKLVRVSSRYKTQPTDSNSNFRYELGASQVTENILSLVPIRFTCTRLFPNVYDPINVLSLQNVVTKELKRITIPTAQYNAEELVLEINHQIALLAQMDASPAQFEMKLIADSFQYTRPASWNGNLMILGDGLGIFIGIPADGFLVESDEQPHHNYEGKPDLSGPSPIFLQSQTIASSNCIDSNQLGGWIPLIASIPTNTTPYGYVIDWMANDIQSNIVTWSSPISIRGIDIQLTDRYGNVLHIRNNIHPDIIFKMTC